MTRDITTAQPREAESQLFDTWFDPIEVGLRARVRGFIAALIEEDLTTVLSRPRYVRRSTEPTGQDGAARVVGYRHGHRTRQLTGSFGSTRLRCPVPASPGVMAGRSSG